MSDLAAVRRVVDLELAEARDVMRKIPNHHIAVVLLALEANGLLRYPLDDDAERWRDRCQQARHEALDTMLKKSP
jgi:hypothetical protein